MSRRNIVNMPASIRDKLLHKSRITQRPFMELLQYFSIERFLYRLSISDHAEKFFLKGALMFRAWQTMDHRATMDMDFLGRTTNTIQNLESICKDLCEQETSLEDGMVFFPESIKGALIQTEAEYEGIRLEFDGHLNQAIVSMQVDIGFGDIITPEPQLLSYPTILDLPAPKLRGYTPETVVVEKLETMVKRGMSNSRMKDFFDVWTLSKQFSFDERVLAQAIKATFDQRGTPIQPSPECFSKAFATDPLKSAQWKTFVHKNRLLSAPASFEHVIELISHFLSPILKRLCQGELVEGNSQKSQVGSHEGVPY